MTIATTIQNLMGLGVPPALATKLVQIGSQSMATGELFQESYADSITAHASGGQASATALTNQVNRVTTVATAADSVVLPTSAVGLVIFVINAGANSLQLFGVSPDTINGVATGTGVPLPAGAVAMAMCTTAGAWTVVMDSPVSAAFNTNTATSGATLSAANVTGGTATVDLAMTGTLGAGANAQMPTVANLVAAIPCFTVGQSYRLRIINRSSANFAWTVTTNTGWTLTGTMTIAQNTWRDFVVTVTSASAATLQAVGIGTDS